MDIRAGILWFWARYRIKRDRPTVIAVGGAIAKTSTKMAIGAVLQEAFPGQVRVGYGNLNTYLGVPLAILGFELDFYERRVGVWQWLAILTKAKWRALFDRLPQYLVLEYGTDHPGDLHKITKKLPPNIGVITIVGPAHLANYPNVSAMVHDEGFVAERTRPDGAVFLNHADPYREEHRARAQAKVREIITPLESMASAYAQAVGEYLKVSPAVIKTGLQKYQQPKHRFNERRIGPYLVLDDSYNASPLAMEAALNRLQLLPGRRIAVLGEMRELGADEVKFHEQVGRYARGRVTVLVGVGELAKHYHSDHWFATAADAAAGLLAILKDGDTILVKGSKAVHMNTIIADLEDHARSPETDDEHH